jgi:hypothetical protein
MNTNIKKFATNCFILEKKRQLIIHQVSWYSAVQSTLRATTKALTVIAVTTKTNYQTGRNELHKQSKS